MTEDQRTRFQEGIALFNRGQFFDCHEALEEVWLQSYGDRKKFLQGLIQVAVALHHLRNGNLAGAQRLLAVAVEKLSGPVPDSQTIDGDALLAALAPLRKQLSAGEMPGNWSAPQILWKALPRASTE